MELRVEIVDDAAEGKEVTDKKVDGRGLTVYFSPRPSTFEGVPQGVPHRTPWVNGESMDVQPENLLTNCCRLERREASGVQCPQHCHPASRKEDGVVILCWCLCGSSPCGEAAALLSSSWVIELQSQSVLKGDSVSHTVHDGATSVLI